MGPADTAELTALGAFTAAADAAKLGSVGSNTSVGPADTAELTALGAFMAAADAAKLGSVGSNTSVGAVTTTESSVLGVLIAAADTANSGVVGSNTSVGRTTVAEAADTVESLPVCDVLATTVWAAPLDAAWLVTVVGSTLEAIFRSAWLRTAESLGCSTWLVSVPLSESGCCKSTAGKSLAAASANNKKVSGRLCKLASISK